MKPRLTLGLALWTMPTTAALVSYLGSRLLMESTHTGAWLHAVFGCVMLACLSAGLHGLAFGSATKAQGAVEGIALAIMATPAAALHLAMMGTSIAYGGPDAVTLGTTAVGLAFIVGIVSLIAHVVGRTSPLPDRQVTLAILAQAIGLAGTALLTA